MKTLAQIAAELQGYDPQALSADGVLAFLSKLVIPVQDVIELPLFEALGRVLAEDVVSPFDVPPHDNSAMDGYAFDAGQLMPDAALALQVVGTALAGKAWAGSVNRVLAGQCVKIMTGAIMPGATDTVVPTFQPVTKYCRWASRPAKARCTTATATPCSACYGASAARSSTWAWCATTRRCLKRLS